MIIMDYGPLIYVLIGGLISLLSIFIQHKFEEKKEIKSHPSEVVYGKIISFSEKATTLLWEINICITQFGLLNRTNEQGDLEKSKQDIIDKTLHFWELTREYSLFLPVKVLDNAKELVKKLSILVVQHDNAQLINECKKLYDDLLNSLRESLGTDTLSKDFFEVFGKPLKNKV